MAASYPSSTKSFTTKNTADAIQAAHVNDLQDEVVAVENGLRTGLAHDVIPDATGSNRDLGTSAAKFRDVNLSRDANIGGVIALTGGQISFPATQAASSGANTLDDYEEGTWTPVVGGSGGTSGQTYTTQVGSYVKIGKLVVAQFTVVLSNKGTITTNVQIQGLPFTVENTTSQNWASALNWNSLASNWVSVVAVATPNTTTADVKGAAAAAAGNSTALATADIANTSAFNGVIIYRASA